MEFRKTLSESHDQHRSDAGLPIMETSVIEAALI